MIIIATLLLFAILLILLYFLCMYKRYEGKNYYNLDDIETKLNIIELYKKDITEELKNMIDNKTDWIKWPERYLYDNEKWNIIPLYGFDIWNKKMFIHCPKTMEFLKKIPDLKTALFSKLSAKTRLKEHQGWEKLSNYILRCHYPLVLSDNNMCYMVVNGERKLHQKYKWLIFDDSKKHYAVNNSDNDRYVLIIDIKRPYNIPKGKSKIKESKELYKLIKYFEQQNKQH